MERGQIRSLAAQPRVFLIFFTFGLQIAAHFLSAVGPEGWTHIFTSLSVFLWLLWFAVVFMMTIPAIDNLLSPYLKHIKWVAIGVGMVLIIMGIIEIIGINFINNGKLEARSKSIEMASMYSQKIGYSDATAVVHMAGEQLLEAKNPYTEANLVETFEIFGLSSGNATPLMDGKFTDIFPYPTEEDLDSVWQEAKINPDIPPPEFEDKFVYPAGSFLFTIPVLAFGLDDLRYFYFFCALLMFGIIIWQSPKKLWPIVILAAFASLELWNEIAFGGTGSLYLLFLFMGWILLPKNLWLSAIFMGLAVTTKQLAWFFIPFYLVLLLRQIGWRRTLQLSGVISGIFLITNLPFILSASKTWVESLLAPLTDPMFPKGVGIISFAINGLIHSETNIIYVSMEIAVLVLSIVWYYFNCRKYPESGLVLAVFPLFFAWRSYSFYFYPAAILVFAMVLINRGRAIPIPDSSK